MNCRPSLELCPSLLLRLRFPMFRSFWLKLRQRCVPSHAVLPSSLSDFAAGLPDELLCPVCALSEYVARTSRFINRPRRLFVSSSCPTRAVSKNGISFLLREVIVNSGASSGDFAAPRAHSIRGIATSSAFFKNWSLSSVLEAASWRSNIERCSIYIRRCSLCRLFCRSRRTFSVIVLSTR